MPKRIAVGLITQPQGAHLQFYLQALAEIEEVESVALADPTGDSAAQAKRILGDKLQGTFHETPAMLRQAQPTMTLVTWEAALAPPQIAAALEANCHVLAEKPACLHPEEFEPLVRKAENTHRHLMLALANRITPPVREARRLIRAGKLGKIYGLEAHLIADQTRLKHKAYHQTWFASKARAGGGHLIWLGLHWLDLAMHITDSPIREVGGMITNIGGQPIDVEDSAVLTLKFENGALGTMTSGYYLDKGYHSHIKVWGEHGWLELADLESTPLVYRITRGTSEAKEVRFEYPADAGGYTPFVRAAVRASAGLEEPPITSRESLRILEVVHAGYRSSELGKTQKLG